MSRDTLILAYWGRRGALARWSLEIARDLAAGGHRGQRLSVSMSNELFPEIAATGAPLLAVRTFGAGWEAPLRWGRFLAARRLVLDHLGQAGAKAFVTLMPHVWSPLLTPALKQAGARTVTIVHDAAPHPGDGTARLNRWLLHDAALADVVVTLSAHVTGSLLAAGLPEEKIRTLFHPSVGTEAVTRPQRAGPPRLLFLGRILAYKGLPLAVEALEMLARDGIRLPLTVAGEGDLSALSHRLAALGARVENRWLSDEEIRSLCEAHDAMLLPYVEASQSGVAGLAMAAGLPVLATPVGGLTEQVQHGVNGLLAARADAPAFAELLRAVAGQPDGLGALAAGTASTRRTKTLAAFLDALQEIALG